jgi:SAM-dependent methyltransferase
VRRPVKKNIPWQIKIAFKILLARLPLSYQIRKKMGFFNTGKMEHPDYALAVFEKHFSDARFAQHTGSFTALELGPGNSLFSALIAHAHGAAHTYLVDVGCFASKNIAPYRLMESRLHELGLRPPNLDKCSTFEELQAACGAEYLTQGLASLRKIPSDSVDFILSNAVLGHVRRAELLPTLLELRRIQRSDGVGSHCNGFGDILSGGMDALRFSERVWESRFMATSGFYTNRIHYQELMRLFRLAGFTPEVVRLFRRATLPIPRRKMAQPFAALPDEDLMVSSLDVLLH